MNNHGHYYKVDEEEKTTEERLAVLEDKLPVLISRIQTYDQVIENLPTITQTLSSVKQSISEIMVSLRAFRTQFMNMQEIVEKTSVDIKIANETIRNQEQIINQSHGDLEAGINKERADRISESDKIKKELISLTNSSVSKAEFNSNMTDVLTVINILKKESSERTIQIKQIESNTSDVQEGIQKLVSSFSSMESQVTASKSSIVSLKTEIEAVRTEIIDQTNKRLNQFASQVNSTIDEMSHKLIPQGSSVKDLRDEMTSQMEIFKLDISNSELKMGNCTKQYSLLEKKLENIYLLLKKHEIK